MISSFYNQLELKKHISYSPEENDAVPVPVDELVMLLDAVSVNLLEVLV